MPRRLALPCLALAACFQGEALRGEPCARDSDCGPRLACLEDGLCDELRCPSGETITLPTFAPDVVLLVDHAIESVMNKGRGHWSLTRALVEQLGAALGAQLPLGLQVVPTAVADSSDPCVARREAQLLPAPDNAAAIADALPLTAATVGEHALRNGLALVVQAFAAVDPTNLRPQAVVLISDGPFNCAEVRTDLEDRVFKFDTELVPAVAAVAAAGTPVFVVGVDVRPTGGIEPTPDATIVEVDPHLAFHAPAEAGARGPGPLLPPHRHRRPRRRARRAAAGLRRLSGSTGRAAALRGAHGRRDRRRPPPRRARLQRRPRLALRRSRGPRRPRRPDEVPAHRAVRRDLRRLPRRPLAHDRAPLPRGLTPLLKKSFFADDRRN